MIEVTEVGIEAAMPFVLDYCRRWDLRTNNDGIENVTWWGAWDGPSLRGVVGLMPIPEMENTVFVYGFYGDGSGKEKRALAKLMEILDDFPGELYGTVYVHNKAMHKVARNRGWSVEAYKPPAVIPGTINLIKRKRKQVWR